MSDKILEAVQKAQDNLDTFKQSSEAELKAIKDGDAKVAKDIQAVEKGLSELAKAVKEAPTKPKEERELAESFGKTMIGIAQKDGRLRGQPLDEEQMKAYTSNTVEGGGALVDNETAQSLRNIQTPYGWARETLDFLPMNGSKISFPETATDVYDVHANLPQGTILGVPPAENLAASLNMVDLTANKMGYYGVIPTELFEDASIAEPLGAWILPQVARRFDYLEDLTLANLLLTSTGITDYTMAAGKVDFSDVEMADLLQGQANVAVNVPNSKWFLHRQIAAALFIKKSTTGAYTFRKDLLDLTGVDSTREIMPNTAASAVSTTFGVYGDIASSVYAGEARGFNVKTTDSDLFSLDVISLLATQRVGFALSTSGAKGLIRLKTAAS